MFVSHLSCSPFGCQPSWAEAAGVQTGESAWPLRPLSGALHPSPLASRPGEGGPGGGPPVLQRRVRSKCNHSLPLHRPGVCTTTDKAPPLWLGSHSCDTQWCSPPSFTHSITILVNRGYVPKLKIRPETRMKGQVRWCCDCRFLNFTTASLTLFSLTGLCLCAGGGRGGRGRGRQADRDSQTICAEQRRTEKPLAL